MVVAFSSRIESLFAALQWSPHYRTPLKKIVQTANKVKFYVVFYICMQVAFHFSPPACLSHTASQLVLWFAHPSYWCTILVHLLFQIGLGDYLMAKKKKKNCGYCVWESEFLQDCWPVALPNFGFCVSSGVYLDVCAGFSDGKQLRKFFCLLSFNWRHLARMAQKAMRAPVCYRVTWKFLLVK